MNCGTIVSASRAAIVSLGLGCLLLSGCAKQSYEGPKRFAVTGAVNVDGKPVQEGVLHFEPIGSGRKVAIDITEGAYSFTEEEGPNVGKHRVKIFAFESVGPAPTGDSEDMGVATRQILPPNFNKMTTLEVEIVDGGNVDGKNVHDFNLKP